MTGEDARRHRGVQWAGLVVGFVFLGALILALLGTRSLRGSIPGTDSILSLAAIHPGLLVGTTGGVFASTDGVNWLAATNIPREPVSVASDGTTAYVLAGGDLKATHDIHTFTTIATVVTGTVIAAGPAGSVCVVAGRSIERIGADGAAMPSFPAPPAPGVLAMAVAPDNPGTVLVGGLRGLWKTTDAGATWQRILGTPTQALVIDPSNTQRILLGSPGGILVSVNGGLQWRFTEMRKDVHGLSQEGGKFLAVTTERLVYGSNDGVTKWTPLTP